MTPIYSRFVLAVICYAFFTSQSFAISTEPSGLPPNTEYRLMFLTDGKVDATSSDIATYNSLVESEGLAATGISGWTAIASTETVDVITNTSTQTSTSGIAVYLIDDTNKLLAPNYATLWGGSIQALLNVTPTDQLITDPSEAQTWTGSTSAGLPFATGELGNASDNAYRGLSSATDTRWAGYVNLSKVADRRLYGISPVLRSPSAATPVPTLSTYGFILTAIGFVLVASRRLRLSAGKSRKV